jgi:hypothetical protein
MSTAKTLWIVLIVALSGLTFAADPARSQVDDAFARVTGHLLKPRQLEFAETRLADLRLVFKSTCSPVTWGNLA